MAQPHTRSLARRLLPLAALAVLLAASPDAYAQRNVDQNDAGCDDVTGTPYCTIQAAVTAAAPGETVLVAPGLYTENILINKNLSLLSTSGRAATSIQGISGAGALGTVRITNNTTALTLGDTGQGFTIIGIDNGSPGIENAAVYFQGGHSDATIRDNEIVADGDHGLLTEFGALITGFVIDGNTFSGQTFLGAEAGGCGFGSQFATPNVPRQLVTMGGGTGGGNTSNTTFTNNQVTGTAGSTSTEAGCTTTGQGNTLATIDSNGATITGNTFAGTTARFATSLRTRGPSTSTSGNTFDSSGLLYPPANGHIFIQNTGELLSTVAGANTFDKGVYVDGTLGAIGLSVESYAENAPAGSTVNVLPGTYVESGQIHVMNDVAIVGADRATTIIMPGFDTGSSGDARGFFLVDIGVTFDLSGVTIDGSGRKVWQAIRTRGSGTVSNVAFTEIKFNPSSSYAGTAIAAFGAGNVDVMNSTFSEIGRIGVQYFGSGITGSTFSSNTYTGKGDGNFLDYALEIGAGAVATAEDNTITDNRGVASSDGSTSAAILVTTFFGAGSAATIEGNDLSDNTTGIAVGFDANDTSSVTAEQNNITGNGNGVFSTAPTVMATCNWWGDPSGPSGAGPGSGDSVDSDTDFDPWLFSPAPSTCNPPPVACTTTAPLVIDAFTSAQTTLANTSSNTPVDLMDCTVAAYEGLSEVVTSSADPTDTVNPGSTYDVALAAPPGPGAIVVSTADLVPGDGVGDALGTIVAAVVYDASGDVYEDPNTGDRAECGNGPGVDPCNSPQAQATLAAAMAALFGGATAGEGSGTVDLSVVAAPNPVSGAGTVSFGLAEGGDVTVALFDALGRQVALLAEGPHGPGRHMVALPAASLPAGVYVVRVVEGGEARTTRLTVAR